MNKKKHRIMEKWWTDWQRKIVENESNVWGKKRFKKTDGYWIENNGGRMLGKVSEGFELPSNEILAKNAWNHEHCGLCWETISEELNDKHEGYADGNDWLCVECYNKYIVIANNTAQ